MQTVQSQKVIICVDNDKEASDYLAACLSAEFSDQVNTVAFTSPFEALEYLKGNQVALVTSCNDLAGMEGFEFIRRVKHLYPEMPVMVITDCGNIDSYFEAMYIGAFEFINKPISRYDLHRVVADALGLSLKPENRIAMPIDFKVKSSKKRIVVLADDDENILMAMCIVLERMGYDVIPAESGEEVLKLIDIIKPDAITLDLDKPVLNGIETLKKIKSDERYANIPVVIISGDTSTEAVRMCGSIGFSSFLKKPVGMDELNAILEKSLYPNRGRKAPRVDLNIQVNLTYKGISQKRFSKTLSEKGIFLRTRDPLPAGSEVELDLPLDNYNMRLKGRVIFINKIDSNTFSLHPGMTIEFHDLTVEDTGRLKDFVFRSICQGLDNLPPASALDRQFHKGA
jgi:DNA-binding NtrC family response regulator